MKQATTQTENKVTFLHGWTPQQFNKMERKIANHFSFEPMHTGHGNYPAMYLGWKAISDRLGLAYTSSSSYSGYWVCNTEVYYTPDPAFKYVGFALGTNHKAYAILWDKEENEKIIPL